MAFQPAQHGQHRRREVPGGVAILVLPRDHVHRHLGVGVAGKLNARGFQFGAQRREVLDNAVVNDRELPVGVAVRIGIAVGRPPVSTHRA